MRLRNAIIRLAHIAEELDSEGHAVEAAALTGAALRAAQFNPYVDNERVPPSQRMWPYRDEENDFQELDDQRNKDPRYMTPEYRAMPGGESGPEDEGANQDNPDGLSIFDMGGRDQPIVTGPARVENEEMSPATSPLDQFTWQNTRGQWDNPAENWKRLVPRR
jgi:hypothetical protein